MRIVRRDVAVRSATLGCILLGGLVTLIPQPVGAQIVDARFLHQPSAAGGKIAFVSDGEIWWVPYAGGTATKVTNDGRPKRAPRLSPDGGRLAYSSEGADGRDVYVTSLLDRTTIRITWHPADDDAEGWSPDGRYLLITSNRSHPFGQFGNSELFQVPASGGTPALYPIGKAYRAAMSPDGTSIAYTPTKDVFRTWRRYRGGQMATIWVTQLTNYSHVEVPKANSNNTNPLWIGHRLYFLSDRGGSFGIYAYDSASSRITPILADTARNIDWLTGEGETLVFADAGYLWRYDLTKGRTARIRITLPDGPLQKIRTDVSPLIKSMALDPSGERLVVEARGDLFLRESTGTQVNLTQSSGVAERDPVWSPDGTLITYVSDEGGEYGLHVRRPFVGARSRRLGLSGRGYPQELTWSPESGRIAYIAPDLGVAWVDVASGVHRHVRAQAISASPLIWTANGKGLFFIDRAPSSYGQVRYIDLDSATSVAVTDSMADVSDIRVDPRGQTLFILASLEAGPVVSEYDASVALFMPTVRSMLYTVSVAAAVAYAQQGDVGATVAFPDLKAAPNTAGHYPLTGRGSDVGVDRAILSAAVGTVLTVQHTTMAEPYYDWYSARERPDDRVGSSAATLVSTPRWSLVRYTLIDDALAPGNDGNVAPSSDDPPLVAKLLARGKLQRSAMAARLLLSSDGKPYCMDVGAGGRLHVAPMTLGPLFDDIDLAAERRQMYEETVRRFRDYFHDPRLHGVDWMAKAAFYRPWLAGIRSRSDLDFVLTHLTSEIGNSHIRVREPPVSRGKREDVGLLGADLVPKNGQVLVARILKASPWDSTGSPLSGLGIAEGDSIQAIDGKKVVAGEDIYRPLVGAAGNNIPLTYFVRLTGTARTVMVRPIGSEVWLRQRAWVEEERRHVTVRSQGRIAYLHQPDTSEGGLSEFVRYFFPQANRLAVIIDERFNHGGADPDYQLDTLGRTRFLWYTRRQMRPLSAPTSVIEGPKVMIVNAEAGSGGDVYPYEFKQRGLGTVIGMPTWGGVNGGYRGGEPRQLIDGGIVEVPDLGSYSPGGEPVLENIGFTPDEVVDIYPADYAAGRDPQLDRAIDILLNQLANHSDELPPRSLVSDGE